MKRTILTLALYLLSLTNLIAQWEIINEGYGDEIIAIDFVNDDIGWLAGTNGILLKTYDFGENWTKVELNQNWYIRQIDFINESVGLMICFIDSLDGSSLIAKSLDGGINWTVQQVLPSVILQSMFAVDENNVYAVGGDTIFKTTNGGTNWIDISPNLQNRYYHSLWFQNSHTGVVVGNYYDGTVERGIIIKTTDGGITWDETVVNEFNDIYDLQFLDASNGYFRAKLDTTNFICKTEDLLSSWTVKTQHPYAITSYQLKDQNTVYATMDSSITRNNIMKSLDGGVNWQVVQSFNISYLTLKKILFNSFNYGFIFGLIREFRYSSNGFALLKTNKEQNFEIRNFSLNTGEWLRSPFPSDITFIDSNKVFIGISFPSHGTGGGHCIFSTTDGGNSWIFGNSADGYILSFSSINDSIGFYSTEWPIYKTTDSGTSWSQIYEMTDGFTGYDNCFMNSENGRIVGLYENQNNWFGRILKTTDGGQEWNVEWTDSIDHTRLKSICFYSQTGWATGDNGSVVKYTPQTGWIKQTSVTTLPLNKVFFSDDNHSWIAGGYQNDNNFQNILLRTTNGGNNWEKVQNVPYLIKDIVFIDNNFGWAIGYDSSGVGGILKSTDGGSTWTIDAGNLSAELNALHIKDGYGWAVGENGLILRTTNAGPTWVENENLTLPTEFALEQNYPNPFNPTTKIKYSMPSNVKGETSKVILKIYDVLGREVAALVNEAKQPGVYEIEFNASKLPSGVYLYRMQVTPNGGQAGDFNAVKKMLLLK
jgi:photosystem II stability/assembly factor-like uncharacterized protein